MGKKEPQGESLRFTNPAFDSSDEEDERIKYDAKDIFGTDADANAATRGAIEKDQEPAELEWDDEMLQDLAFAFDACDIDGSGYLGADQGATDRGFRGLT